MLGYGMIIATAYNFIEQFFPDWIPYAILPEVRAACLGAGTIAIFVQCRRWGQNELPYSERTIFGIQIVVQVICTWMSLFLVQGVTILLLSLIGYVSGSKKVPMLAHPRLRAAHRRPLQRQGDHAGQVLAGARRRHERPPSRTFPPSSANGSATAWTSASRRRARANPWASWIGPR